MALELLIYITMAENVFCLGCDCEQNGQLLLHPLGICVDLPPSLQAEFFQIRVKYLSIKLRENGHIMLCHILRIGVCEKIRFVSDKKELLLRFHIVEHGHPVNHDFSGIRPDHTAHHAKERTLTGSVRADQTENIPFLYRKIHMIDGWNL